MLAEGGCRKFAIIIQILKPTSIEYTNYYYSKEGQRLRTPFQALQKDYPRDCRMEDCLKSVLLELITISTGEEKTIFASYENNT